MRIRQLQYTARLSFVCLGVTAFLTLICFRSS